MNNNNNTIINLNQVTPLVPGVDQNVNNGSNITIAFNKDNTSTSSSTETVTPSAQTTPPNESSTITSTSSTTEDSFYAQSTIDLAKNSNSSIIDGVLRTNIHVPVNFSDRKQMIIVLVDKSGSIRSAWTQIQTTLLNLFSIVLANQQQEIILEIVFFNNTAYRLNWNKDNYKQLILAERPNGKTCFAATFDITFDIIKQYYKKQSDFKSDLYYDPKTDCSIVFLTDGSHTTTRDAKGAFSKLSKLNQSITNATVTAHTMGFTQNSRFNDLDGIRRTLGNKPGIYQYCEQNDGPFAIQEKLRFIFGLILTTSDTKIVRLSLPSTSGMTFLESGKNEYELELRLDTNGDSDLNGIPITLDVNKSTNSKFLLDPAKDKDFEPLELVVRIGQLTTTNHIVPNRSKQEDMEVLMSLVRVECTLKTLMDTIKSHNAQNIPTEEQKKMYIKSILDLQSQLGKVDNNLIFTFSKSVRGEVTQIKSTCMRLSSQLLEIVNQWIKQDWNASSTARMADITYQFMFRNAGRQRRANAKVTRNANAIINDTQRFKQLDVDMEELEQHNGEQLYEASKTLFSCTLSLCQWDELVEEKDVLGFGLAIQRPETVIDDPTQIRVVDYSTTFIAKSSIEDALALAINSQGQDKATGGFKDGNVSVDKVASVIRGRGREPINAWLPLYLHPLHWKAAQLQLRSIIAYFVTLDPMAFAHDQMNGIFLVLGTMISKEVGERQLLLIIQLIRTIREMAIKLNFLKNIKAQITTLLTKPIYLVAEQPKNIFVVIAYLLVLTEEEIKEIFQTESKRQDSFIVFWEGVLESAIRRNCFTFFREKSESVIDQFVFNVLYGDRPNATQITSSGEASMTTQQLFDQINNLDKSKISYAPDTNQLEEYLKIILAPVDPNDPQVISPATTVYENRQYTTLNKFSSLMQQLGYPTTPALFNCLQFTYAWRKIMSGDFNIAKDQQPTAPIPNYNAFKVLDDHYGLAPNEWIEYIKSVSSNQLDCSLGNYLLQVQKFYGGANQQPISTLINKIRSMISQGALYRTNKVSNGIVEQGLYCNSNQDPEKCLLVVEKQVQDRRAIILKRIADTLAFSQTIASGMKSTDMDSFRESIPVFSNQYFGDFVAKWQTKGLDSSVPFARQKLVMILSNCVVSVGEDGVMYSVKIHPHRWSYGRVNFNKFNRAWKNFISIANEASFHQYIMEKPTLE